jgi:hypothetical protein
MCRLIPLLLVLAVCLNLTPSDSRAGEKPALPLLFKADFENEDATRWQPTDPKVWKIAAKDGKHFYCQFKQSDYKPPFRSPLNFALVKDLDVTDFVLDAQVQSTTKDYGHRDVCLFFGYQGPARFYYVHLAKQTDDRANQVFLVSDADRKKISTKTTPGTPWDDHWHHVRVVRKVADGTIAVYFDDMKTPVMTAQDKTFTWGRVGVGSFDDTSNWDDIQLHGKRKE